jgi:hypothetical protein
VGSSFPGKDGVGGLSQNAKISQFGDGVASSTANQNNPLSDDKEDGNIVTSRKNPHHQWVERRKAERVQSAGGSLGIISQKQRRL